MDSSDSENETIERHASKRIPIDAFKKEEEALKRGRGRPRGSFKKQPSKILSDEKLEQMNKMMNDYHRLKSEENKKQIENVVEKAQPVNDRFHNVVETELKSYISNLATDNRFFGNVLKSLSSKYLAEHDALPSPSLSVTTPSPQIQNVEEFTISPKPKKEKKSKKIVLSLPSETEESEIEVKLPKLKRQTNKPEKKKKRQFETETETETEIEPVQKRQQVKVRLSEGQQWGNAPSTPGLSFF